LKKALYILTTSLLILAINSCGETVDFRNGLESEKIVVESILSPNAQINFAKLSTSVVVNAQVQNLEYPIDATVRVRELNSQEEFELIYDDNKCYSYSGASIKEGKTYEFSASLIDSDVLDVFATTKIPLSNTINNVEQIRRDTIYDPDDITKYGLKFECAITLDDPVSYPAHYRLIPMLKDFGVDTQGKLFLKSDNVFYFDNFDFVFGGNACHDLSHRNGFLVKQSKLDGNRIVLTFETETRLVLGEDRVPKIFFALQTVEEDFYHYFLSSSKLIDAQNSGSSQVISSFSNVTNGHGVFTSFSETLDSLLIN